MINLFFDENCANLIDIYRFDNIDKSVCSDTFEGYLRRHYQTMQKAVESGLFNILAHLDYARRVSYHKELPFKEERLSVVNSLKNSKMAVELSTKGLRKVGSFYPEDFVLNEIVRNNIGVVISDDAHDISELGYEFEKAEKVLEQLNCVNRYRLK